MIPRTGVLNLAWQLGDDREALLHATADVDVLMVCEIRGPHGEQMDLRDYLPDGWATNQDLTDADKSMVALCWRTDTVDLVADHEPVLLSRPGRNVRARYLANADLRYKADGDTRRYGAAHAPLLATGRKGEWFRNLRTWLISHPRAVVGCDGNTRLMRRVSRLLNRHVIGAEVMFLTVPAGWAATRTTAHTRGSDHPILRGLFRRATRRPRRRRKKARR